MCNVPRRVRDLKIEESGMATRRPSLHPRTIERHYLDLVVPTLMYGIFSLSVFLLNKRVSNPKTQDRPSEYCSRPTENLRQALYEALYGSATFNRLGYRYRAAIRYTFSRGERTRRGRVGGRLPGSPPPQPYHQHHHLY